MELRSQENESLPYDLLLIRLMSLLFLPPLISILYLIRNTRLPCLFEVLMLPPLHSQASAQPQVLSEVDKYTMLPVSLSISWVEGSFYFRAAKITSHQKEKLAFTYDLSVPQINEIFPFWVLVMHHHLASTTPYDCTDSSSFLCLCVQPFHT